MKKITNYARGVLQIILGAFVFATFWVILAIADNSFASDWLRYYPVFMIVTLGVTIMYVVLDILGINDDINYFFSVIIFVKSSEDKIVATPVVWAGMDKKYLVCVKFEDVFLTLYGEENVFIARNKNVVFTKVRLYQDAEKHIIFVKPLKLID